MAEQQMNKGGAPVAEQPKVEQPKVEVQTKEQQQTLFDQAKALVESMVPWDKFKRGAAGSGLSIFDNGAGRGTRLLKVVESKKGLRVEFNVDVEKTLKEKAQGQSIIYTEKEAKDKHMGTCRWIYTGSDLNVLKVLVAQALSGFAPKVKEEKKKDEKQPEGKAVEKEAPKAPAEPVKGSRQLTEEEKKALGMNEKAVDKKDDKKKAQ